PGARDSAAVFCLILGVSLLSRPPWSALRIVCFFHGPAPSEIYTLSLHDALPIFHFFFNPSNPFDFLRMLLLFICFFCLPGKTDDMWGEHAIWIVTNRFFFKADSR